MDYGLGNLFSVKQACASAGLSAVITSSRKEILGADAVILPGVGAFGDAMANLRRLDLVGPLRDYAGSGRPLVGICLGMQLLMSESSEFGRHEGLGFVKGQVIRFEGPAEGTRVLKVPQVGWNRMEPVEGSAGWSGSLLDGVAAGASMYFVHSFYVRPADRDVVLATSRYGQIDFCSALCRGSVTAFQCHPERSGPVGLQVYANLARQIQRRQETSLEAGQ